MIAKRFGFTREFMRERNTDVLPTEENSLRIQRSGAPQAAFRAAAMRSHSALRASGVRSP